MVARVNQWLPRTNSDGPLKLVLYQPIIMGITAQNMTINFKFNIITHAVNGC